MAKSPQKAHPQSQMTSILFFVIFISIGTTPTAGKFLYTAVGSSTLISNSDYKITTTLNKLEGGRGKVRFTFDISSERNKSVSEGQIELKTEGSQKVLSLKIPLLPEDENRYILSVRATDDDGVTFSKDVYPIVLESRNSSLIVQTDKPIYKPGERMRFRVFLLDRFFPPLGSGRDRRLEVIVYDPRENIIKRWAELEVKGWKGFVSEEMELSSEPNLGDWIIKVRSSQDSMTEKFRFSVQEYILPKYKVEIAFTPSCPTYKDSKVNLEISARYTYGKPVFGKCNLIQGDPEIGWRHYNEKTKGGDLLKTVHLDEEKGVTNIPFDALSELGLTESDVSGWSRKPVNLLVTCTDKMSGKVENATTTIHLYPESYELYIVGKPECRLGQAVNLTIKLSTPKHEPIGDKRPNALTVTINPGPASSSGVAIHSSVPDNGIIPISLQAPNLTSGYNRIVAKYKNLEVGLYFECTSANETYMQIKKAESFPAGKPREGETVPLFVKSNKDFKVLNVLILSRGMLIHSEIIKFKTSLTETPVNLKLPLKSFPNVNIVVYTTLENKEQDLIAATFYLTVLPHVDKQLEISLSKKILEPGENATITFKGFKNSVVGIRAVDQSVFQLKENNDMTMEKLAGIGDEFRERDTRYYRGGGEIFWEFRRNGFAVLTNAKLMKPDISTYYNGYPLSSYKVTNHDVVNQPRVRSNFPETWIWEEVESPEGIVTINKMVPDTMTSWFINAFQINEEMGLGLAEMSPTLTGFRPFFITLNLPYSIVTGEILGLEVIVHNYMDKEVHASVTLDNEDNFFKFMESDVDAKSMVKTVVVKASGISSVIFPISPLKFRMMKLNVKATTTSGEAGDAVSRSLIVRPPGLKHVQNSAVFVNLLDSMEFSKTDLKAVFPEERVPGADSLKVSVIGDIMGGAINNFDKLIVLPQGCGEQNIAKFVTNIVTLDYLNATGKLTEEIRRKAIGFLERGYQTQLAHATHGDSFSFFGESDKEGSTWLTALVARAFIQARRYITVDQSIIEKSLRYLIRQQSDNGSFSEKGYVQSEHLLGGAGLKSSTKHLGLGLTAYVLLTFAEAKKANIDLTNTEFVSDKQGEEASILDRGVSYLLKNSVASELRSSYEVNLIAYLLHYIDHAQKDEYFKALESMKMTNDSKGTSYWEQGREVIPSDSLYHQYRQQPWQPTVLPSTVEITSYALLTHLLRGVEKLEHVFPIVRWLIQNRNLDGGFYTSQDTLMGITALGKFAERIHTKKTKDKIVKVKISYEDESHLFTIGKDNRTVPQEYFLPPGKVQVDIEGKGQGSALAQLTWSYYVNQTDDFKAFKLTAKLKDSGKGKKLMMRICTAYKLKDTSNMAILEANTPSGYAFDNEDLDNLRRNKQVFKRYELENKDSKVNLYFQSISKKQMCLELKAYRIYLVAKHQPGLVQIYDYYNNQRKTQVSYEVPPISVCDICKVEPNLSCDRVEECKKK